MSDAHFSNVHVNIILFNIDEQSPLEWPLGTVHRVSPTADAINALTSRRENAPAAWLFWDTSLGQPDVTFILNLLTQKGDVWHAGLRLGTSGQPDILDYVNPTEWFSRDLLTDQVGASWRISLRCCLVRTDVLHHDPLPQGFDSLEAAALTAGYRWLRSGVILLNMPSLIPATARTQPTVPQISFADELRFISTLFSRQLRLWALMRVVINRRAGLKSVLQTARRVQITKSFPQPYRRNNLLLMEMAPPPIDSQVTVLIATLDRYPYLRVVLDQLRRQTIKPHQIIVISDIQPQDPRDLAIADEFSDLPLIMLYHDVPGQCSCRNAGLWQSTGEYVLFIDDDDEIEPTLIESHLKNLLHFQAQASSGSVDETGALPLPKEYLYTRLSDVFPTNNSLIRRDVLRHSGLFDMALNKRQSEDGDLGMRMYLAGALMIYNPQISVFHHHAPSGGLRAHKARVITYSSSRLKLLHRRLPHVSEVYHMYRYFTKRQVRESAWMTVFGTFSIRGSKFRKLLKIAVSALLLPDTLWKMRQKHIAARALLKTYPQIPTLDQSERALQDSSVTNTVTSPGMSVHTSP